MICFWYAMKNIFCWVWNGPKIISYKCFYPYGLRVFHPITSFILTQDYSWVKHLDAAQLWQTFQLYSYYIAANSGRGCHGPPLTGPTAHGSRPTVVAACSNPWLFGYRLKTFAMPNLFVFHRLLSIMMGSIADFIEDFMKSIQMSEQQHYK